MNYLIPAYALILSGIIGYQVTLCVRAKKLEDLRKASNPKRKVE